MRGGVCSGAPGRFRLFISMAVGGGNARAARPVCWAVQQPVWLDITSGLLPVPCGAVPYVLMLLIMIATCRPDRTRGGALGELSLTR